MIGAVFTFFVPAENVESPLRGRRWNKSSIPNRATRSWLPRSHSIPPVDGDEDDDEDGDEDINNDDDDDEEDNENGYVDVKIAVNVNDEDDDNEPIRQPR